MLADEIRSFVFQRYIRPAREKGLHAVTVSAGEIHQEMGLNNRIPAVCGALKTRKLEVCLSVRLIKREGPHQGAGAKYTYTV